MSLVLMENMPTTQDQAVVLTVQMATPLVMAQAATNATPMNTLLQDLLLAPTVQQELDQ